MRGRRAQPAEVKALKGNPGKRKLALTNPDQLAAKLKPATVKAPDFLTDERERRIFTEAVENYQPQGVARPTDRWAFGRWAVWMHRWLKCKEWLDGKHTWVKSKSKWGEMLRRPAAKDLFDIEDKLQRLEDRLGLNPVARQSIIRGLAAVPPALGGVLSEDNKAKEEEQAPAIEQEIVAANPLGYLRAVRKLN